MKDWKKNNVIRFVFQYEKESCICYMIITTFFIACFWCFKDIYILLWKLVTTITLFKVILSFVCAWWLPYIVFKIVVFSRFCDIPLGEKIDKNKFDTVGNYIDFIENIQKPRYRILRYHVKEYPLPQDTTLYAYAAIFLAILTLFVPLCFPTKIIMIFIFGISLVSIGFGTQGRKCPFGVAAVLSVILPYAVLVFYGGSYIFFLYMYGTGKLW